MKPAKKSSSIPSITYDDAVDVALCYGWIDSQKKGCDAQLWLQKFTPRRSNSILSKRNRKEIKDLVATEKMQPTGLKAMDEAKTNDKWDAAYDS